MAALDFPAAPAVNDTYTANGRTFTWNGETWMAEGNRPLTATETIDFPASPDVDDTYEASGRMWTWNGESWRFTPVLSDPFTEIIRQESVVSGKLTLNPHALSGYRILHARVSNVTITTDDSAVSMRLYIGGSLISTSSYRWGYQRLGIGDAASVGSAGLVTEIALSSGTATFKVGNAAGEGLTGDIYIFEPGESTWTYVNIHTEWIKPDGTGHTLDGGAHLENTGVVTGFEIFAESNLTGGRVLVTGTR